MRGGEGQAGGTERGTEGEEKEGYRNALDSRVSHGCAFGRHAVKPITLLDRFDILAVVRCCCY